MWSSADFNADGFTDGRDFNIWNRQAFTAADHQVRRPGGVADRVPRAPLANEMTAGITARSRSQSLAGTAQTQFSPVDIMFARIAAMQRPKFQQSLRLLVPANV
jgi:hypothetical protein